MATSKENKVAIFSLRMRQRLKPSSSADIGDYDFLAEQAVAVGLFEDAEKAKTWLDGDEKREVRHFSSNRAREPLLTVIQRVRRCAKASERPNFSVYLACHSL